MIGHDRDVKRALAGSLIAHGVLGALLLAMDAPQPPADPPPRIIDIVDVIEAPPPKPPPAPAIDKPGGGGTEAARLQAPKPTVRVAARTVREVIGSYEVDHGIGDGGTGGGEGGGIGGGRGAGIGLGEGGSIAAQLDTPAPPPPPEAVVSKARPPKLIYPKRQRATLGDQSDVFVARVTVDTDGYVVGARMVHKLGGPQDDQAAQLIWRFRYAPALDDDGHAIKATIEQPFMVGR